MSLQARRRSLAQTDNGYGVQRVRGAAQHFFCVFPGGDRLAVTVKLKAPSLQAQPLCLMRRELVACKDFNFVSCKEQRWQVVIGLVYRVNDKRMPNSFGEAMALHGPQRTQTATSESYYAVGPTKPLNPNRHAGSKRVSLVGVLAYFTKRKIAAPQKGQQDDQLHGPTLANPVFSLSDCQAIASTIKGLKSL